jgi:Uma2 family endonuclease
MVPFEIVSQEHRRHASDNDRRLSIGEWVTLPEDEPGELVDGCLVEEEMPDLVHEIVVSWLLRTLGAWLGDRGGFVFGSEVKLVVGARGGRKPDVSLYLPNGAVPPRRGPVRIPPDVVVEIVSPTARDARRDRIDKVTDYATFGVRYYWLIDPAARTFEILELGTDAGYVRALGAAEGRLDAIPGCAGLTIDLDALWSEIERLGPPAPDDTPSD